MDASTLVTILEDYKGKVEETSLVNKIAKLRTEVSKKKEQLDKLEQIHERYPNLSKKIDELIAEFKRKNVKITTKREKYIVDKEARQQELNHSIDGEQQMGDKFDLFQQKVENEKQFLKEVEIREQKFHQYMLDAVAEIRPAVVQLD